MPSLPLVAAASGCSQTAAHPNLQAREPDEMAERCDTRGTLSVPLSRTERKDYEYEVSSETTHRTSDMEGSRSPLSEGSGITPPAALRRGSQTGQAHDRRGGRFISGLLQESRHRRDSEASYAARRGIGIARADRRYVSGRQDQHHGKPRCSACSSARTERGIDRC